MFTHLVLIHITKCSFPFDIVIDFSLSLSSSMQEESFPNISENLTRIKLDEDEEVKIKKID